MSENEINMIMRGIEKLEEAVSTLRDSFVTFCTESTEKFTRLDDRIKNIEQDRLSEIEHGKWSKEWSLKKWLAIISFISLSGVVITIINIISGWI